MAWSEAVSAYCNRDLRTNCSMPTGRGWATDTVMDRRSPHAADGVVVNCLVSVWEPIGERIWHDLVSDKRYHGSGYRGPGNENMVNRQARAQRLSTN